MKYFVDYDVPKNFKIGIDGLERNIPTRKHSHNAAWVHLYKNMLHSAGWENVHVLGNHDTYEGYDAMIFYPGIAYAGTINFFFGVDDNVVRRFSRIQDFAKGVLNGLDASWCLAPVPEWEVENLPPRRFHRCSYRMSHLPNSLPEPGGCSWKHRRCLSSSVFTAWGSFARRLFH